MFQAAPSFPQTRWHVPSEALAAVDAGAGVGEDLGEGEALVELHALERIGAIDEEFFVAAIEDDEQFIIAGVRGENRVLASVGDHSAAG